MQNLDVISINFWHVVISFANLVILYWILKKFLYAPVNRVIQEREDDLTRKYNEAADALATAEKNRADWEEKMAKSDEESIKIVTDAEKRAKIIENSIISHAKEEAQIIVKNAEEEANSEYMRSKNEIKSQIADISAGLAEKILNREINSEDHRGIIENVIEEIGDADE